MSDQIIITDSTDLSKLTGARGYEQRDWTADPLAGGPFSRAYDGPRLSSDDERRDLIADRERKGETNIAMAKHYGLLPYDQARTNFCWANAVVMLVDFTRRKAGMKPMALSSASVACRITGFRNVGGWCSKALAYICEHGVAPAELWPNAAVNKGHDNPESQAARDEIKVTEFDDIEPKDDRLLIDYLLLNGPAANATMLWSHATLAMDPVWTGKGFGVVNYNSGYGRDRNGLTTLTGKYLRQDEVVGIRVISHGGND